MTTTPEKVAANSMLDEIDAGRVLRLRLSRGLTQAELAEHLGLASAHLSRILAGHQKISHELRQELADVLDCDVELLLNPVREFLHTKPWLRAYADAPKKSVEQFVADSLLAVEVVKALRLKQIPERLPAFDGDPVDGNAIDEFALSVRDAADIATDHVPNATRAAERLGCIVLPMEHELGRHMGMSLFIDGTPVIRAARPSFEVPGDRQRFTLAHELGHLTMHQTTPPPDSTESARAIELQAHRFAGSFLLPADSFLADIEQAGYGKVTLTTLTKLKSRWGVSIKAMVVRLQQLHRIDADHARSLYKQISARGWNKSEPVPVSNENALWLSQALARRDSENPPETRARFAGLGMTYFNYWLDWSNSNSDATVLPFTARR